MHALDTVMSRKFQFPILFLTGGDQNPNEAAPVVDFAKMNPWWIAIIVVIVLILVVTLGFLAFSWCSGNKAMDDQKMSVIA